MQERIIEVLKKYSQGVDGTSDGKSELAVFEDSFGEVAEEMGTILKGLYCGNLFIKMKKEER